MNATQTVDKIRMTSSKPTDTSEPQLSAKACDARRGQRQDTARATGRDKTKLGRHRQDKDRTTDRDKTKSGRQRQDSQRERRLTRQTKQTKNGRQR